MKAPGLALAVTLFAAALPGRALAAEAGGKVTFQDQILPLFKNSCLNCHNPDKKKAGLDLSTYQTTLAGSDNGKVVESGNPGASLLAKCCKHTEEPKMPPKGDKLSEADLALLDNWIKGQLLETINGKAVVASNNVQTAVVSLTRPEGPAPMPATDLPLEPFVHTKGSNALVALAASPWAPLVAVGGQKQIILYNTETLEPLGILPFPEGFPSIIRFSRNGKLLLTGGGLGGKSGKVVLWDVQTGDRAGEVGNEFDQVLGADLSPDQAHVALGGPGKILKIYSTKDGKLEHSIKKHTDWITAVAYSPDGKYLASADRNGGISVWEGATGQEFTGLPGHKAAVTALAFMPGVLASAGEDGKIMLWDVKEGKEIRNWAGHAGGVSSVDFTPDGRLVSAGRDKLAKAWDQTGKILMTSEPFQDIALRAVLAEDRLIAGDWTGSIRVFNLKDGGKAKGEITSNPPPITEGLATCQKMLEDARAAVVRNTEALAAAEAGQQKLWAAELQRREAAYTAAETAAQQAQAELEVVKNAPGEAATSLQERRAKLAEAAQALSSASESARADAQARWDQEKAGVAEWEGKLARTKAGQGDRLASATKKQQETGAVLAKAAEAKKSGGKLPPSPEVLARVDEATKKVEVAKAEVARVTALRDNEKPGTPERTQGDARIGRRTAVLAEAQAELDRAKEAAQVSPQEAEMAHLKGTLEDARAIVARQTSALQRWQRAGEYMKVHRSKQALADLQARQAELQATVKDALSPIDKAAADLAAAERTRQETPALLKVKEAEAAGARTAAEAATQTAATAETLLAQKEAQRKAAEDMGQKAAEQLPALTKRQMTAKAALERQQQAGEKRGEEGTPETAAFEAKMKKLQDEAEQSQKALEAETVVANESKAKVEALQAETAKAKEALTTARLAAKKQNEALKKAEAALASTRQAGEDAQKTAAELKRTSDEIAKTAHEAKTKAEQESVAVAQKLEAAKAEAERTRAEFNTRYRSASAAPMAAQPLASF